MAFEEGTLGTLIILISVVLCCYIGNVIVVLADMEHAIVFNPQYNYSQGTGSNPFGGTDLSRLNETASNNVDIWGIFGFIFSFMTFQTLNIPMPFSIIFYLFLAILMIAIIWQIIKIARDFASFIPFVGD